MCKVSFWVPRNFARLLMFLIYGTHLAKAWYKVLSLDNANGVGNPLTGLIPPHFCACTKPGPEFPTSYMCMSLSFSCSVSWGGYWDVIVRFVDIWWNCWPPLFKVSFHSKIDPVNMGDAFLEQKACKIKAKFLWSVTITTKYYEFDLRSWRGRVCMW